MNVTRFQLAIGCVLLAGVITTWQLSKNGGFHRSQTSRHNDGAAGDFATAPVADTELRQTPGLGAGSSFQGTSNGAGLANSGTAPQASMEDLIALMAKGELFPSHVAKFQPGTESEVIHRYQTTQSLVEKEKLAALLAYGGGAAAVSLFTNALFHEFVGKALDPLELVLVSGLPLYLGILAGREDAALEFLLSGVQGQLDLRQPAWETGEHKLEERVLRGAFWKGLGWSGRREARQLLSEVLLGQRLEFVKNVEGAVVDAAYYLRVVESHGLDEMVRLSRDLSGQMDGYRRWKHSTEEGRAWDEWWHAHSPDVRPGTRPSTSRQR